MKIKTLEKIDTAIVALVEPNGGFILFPNGRDVYSIVSDNIFKSQILQYKEDALANRFDLKKLTRLWMK